MKKTITSKEELIRVWDKQIPVKYQSPHCVKPIIATVRSIISVNENGQKFTEIELRQPPNSRIVTIPRYISLLTPEELDACYKENRSPELRAALSALPGLREELTEEENESV